MSIGERIKNAREAKDMTQEQLGDLCHTTKQTIFKYETGIITNIPLPRIELIASALDVSAAYLMGWSECTTAPSISPAGQRIGLLYDRATERDRNIVDAVLAPYDDGKIVAFPAPEKHIPLISTAMAAGPGEMDTGLPWEDYTVPADSKADFAVRVSGDSMEPVLEDGQIALCREKRPELGDVAIMMVNGSFYVKQFIPDYFGNIYLRSLNRKRKDCDYDIMASGNDTVKCYGIVILPKRPALVDQ